MRELKMPTKEQILSASKRCPDVKKTLEELFPEAFEDEWKDVTTLGQLQARRDTCLDEIGIVIPPENHYMPFNVTFIDAWKGDRTDGNPTTKIAEYKIRRNRIYRKLI